MIIFNMAPTGNQFRIVGFRVLELRGQLIRGSPVTEKALL